MNEAIDYVERYRKSKLDEGVILNRDIHQVKRQLIKMETEYQRIVQIVKTCNEMLKIENTAEIYHLPVHPPISAPPERK